MSRQAALPLSWPDRYNIDNFIVADCNEQAFDLVCHPEKWPSKLLIIQGPDFSGKTHLAYIFQKLHNAKLIDKADELEQVEDETIAIDSIDRLIIKMPSMTENLFHLVNSAMLGGKRVLLTLREAPSTWAKLPDLLSRLQASQQVALEQPDTEMIKQAYKKLFIDRGLIVDIKVLDYLAVRSQRSFSEIQGNVAKLDNLSLETGRKITIPLIQSAWII
jgi:chromosomal replication initiation ATPase DnaA